MSAIIRVDGLVKHFRKRKSDERIVAVDDVSFEVGRGEIVGLLGPNGAGKTTIIKVICGLLEPDEGRVSVNGFHVGSERRRALRDLSVVLEGSRNHYWRLTVTENMEYFVGNRGRSRASVQGRIRELLEQFRLAEKADELVGKLSRGMQQKLALAIAVLADTEVILLDEPTLGLDVETTYEVRDLLREIAAEGHTVLVSTHDMSMVQDLCDRAVVVNDGRLVVDEPVADLLEGFETSVYEVRFGRALAPEQQERLEDRIPVCRYTDGDRPSLEVYLESAEEIYELIGMLEKERAPVESIERSSVNFERVFLEIVRGRVEAGDLEDLEEEGSVVVA